MNAYSSIDWMENGLKIRFCIIGAMRTIGLGNMGNCVWNEAAAKRLFSIGCLATECSAAAADGNT